MRKKLTGFLIAVYLLAGCSSGGGVDGAGGVGTTRVGEFLLAASLVTPAIVDVGCTGEEIAETVRGTFRITLINIESTTGDLFPSGIIVESYTTSYNPQTSGAPPLASRTFGDSQVTINGDSLVLAVVIADTQTIREYNGKTGGRPESYVITVRARGRGLSGEAFSITANSISEFRGGCAEEEEEAPA